MSKVNLIIDKVPVSVESGTTILVAAQSVGIDIPHLCYHPDQNVKANCRICVVEVDGWDKVVPSCSTFVREGMVIKTSSTKARQMQRNVLELILANHDQDCLRCPRNGNCELQNICERFGITRTDFVEEPDNFPLDNTNPVLVRDMSKCIKCDRCVEACQLVQEVDILTHSHRSSDFQISTAYNDPLENTLCTFCGQCAAACPVGAIVEKDDTDIIWDAINDDSKHVIVQIAPSVRVALGDDFGRESGAIVSGQMVAAVRRLGFDKVFDTNFSADLTIMEEASELIDRVTNSGTLPMITSCSPGWVNFVEGKFPEILDHISTCKSPQQMFGAIAKSYYPEKSGIDAKDIFSVSVMPCTAKKYEAKRPEMEVDGLRDVDAVITTRELAKMIKAAGINFDMLEEEEFDSPFGIASGAGAIFGATGGVMEAAVRTAYEFISGKPLEHIEFENVRGFEGVKEATIDIDGLEIKIAIANGLGNAKTVAQMVKDGNSGYHFIEIMACPGGCIGGGGQPIATTAIKEKRMESIYEIDKNKKYRKSHDNPDIKVLYDSYLGKPLGEKSHKLLHTHYAPKVLEYDFSGVKTK